jgi:hypothetical protein
MREDLSYDFPFAWPDGDIFSRGNRPRARSREGDEITFLVAKSSGEKENKKSLKIFSWFFFPMNPV